MNTYFRKVKSLVPIYKGGHKIHKEDLLISSIENKIYYTNDKTGEIEKEIIFNKEVTYFAEYENSLVVGLVDGAVVYNHKTHQLHKTKISCIKIIDDLIITTSTDKTMKIMNNAFELISTVYCLNTPHSIVDGEKYIITYDAESNIYLYEKNGGKRYRLCVSNKKLEKLIYFNEIIYLIYPYAIFKVYFSKEIGRKQTDLFYDNKTNEINAGTLDFDSFDNDYNASDAIIKDNLIYLVGEQANIISLDLKCKEIKTYKIKNLGTETKSLQLKTIEFNDFLVLTTTEDEILFLDKNYEIKNTVIGNNDEITDFCVYKNTMFIATNSGRLRYTDTNCVEGQFACLANILEAHEEAIMCIKFCDNYFVTSSRDKKLKIWEISEYDDKVKKIKQCDGLNIKIVGKIETHIESVNSCDIGLDIIASVGKDQSLQIFKYKKGVEQIFNKIVHTKEINHVQINEAKEIIITASQDKSLKAFDFKGNEIASMNGHRKGVWSLDIGKNIMVSCSSDETIRVWSLDDFSCLKILEGFNCTILKVKLYDDDTKVIGTGANGTIKIWDIKKSKIIGVYNEHKDKIWALFYHDKNVWTGASDGILNILQDETIEKTDEIRKQQNEEKVMKFEIQKSILTKDFLNALKISYKFNNIDEIYRLTVECINNNENIENIFGILEEDYQKILKAISKYIKYFRFASVNQMLVKECLRRGIYEKKDDTLIKNVEKSFKAINDLYIDYVGLELYFKEFTE